MVHFALLGWCDSIACCLKDKKKYIHIFIMYECYLDTLGTGMDNVVGEKVALLWKCEFVVIHLRRSRW